jgi:hypothetical protein
MNWLGMLGGGAKTTVRFLSAVLSLTKGSAERAYRRTVACYRVAGFALRTNEGRPFDTASASLRPTQEPPFCTLGVFGGALSQRLWGHALGYSLEALSALSWWLESVRAPADISALSLPAAGFSLLGQGLLCIL